MGAPRLVILVDFPFMRDKDPRVALGHASLLANLAAVSAAEVVSMVVPVDGAAPSVAAVADRILDEARGRSDDEVDFAVGAYVWCERELVDLLRLLRRRGFRGRIILGGPQISYSGPGLEQLYPEADVFVRGYGEQALAALADDPGRPSIAGVHYAGALDHCAQTEVDLETLPSPHLSSSGACPERFLRFETQRGCPYRCGFCQHRAPDRTTRRRALGAPRVMAEIDLFCATGVKEIAVLDPIFNIGARADEILARFVSRGYRGRLSLQCRAELVTERFLDLAAQLDVVLEFGLQTIHDAEGDAVERRNDVSRVSDVLSEVRARGIDHEVSLIFGLPEQTLDSFERSVGWCLERRVPVVKAFPLLLLRGTPIERDRARWGLVEDGGPMPMVVESNSFSRAEWRRMATLAEALKETERRHPTQLSALGSRARALEPNVGRWRPETRRFA